MAAIAPLVPVSDTGFITRFLLWVSGVDEETLRECPAQDWDNVRAIALLLIASWVYQGALIAIAAHLLLAPEGGVHPTLVAGAFFISTVILLIDSYVFLRAGFHADGIRELARAGIDLSGGWIAKLTARIFLSLRIMLSAALAQLTALIVGLVLWQADIAADLNHRFQQENASVIAAATSRADADDRQAADAVKGAQERVDGIQKQIDTTLRYLRNRSVWRNKERAHQAQAALPELEQDLRTATTDLNGLQETLARLRAGRAEAIQEEIDKSPARVERASGILAQLKALRRLADDPVVGAFILLIDVISFGLELAAVLAKVTTFIPSTYAALLARNSFMRVTVIADELEDFINRRERPGRNGPRDGQSGGNIIGFPGAGPGKPPTGKRPRGRPRKNRPDDESPTPVA